MTGREHSEHSGHSEGSAESFSKSVAEIAGAEAEAKRKVEAAGGKVAEIISKARANAAEIAGKAALEAEEKREGIVATEKRKVEVENAVLLEKAKARAAELKRKPFRQLAAKLAKEILREG